MDKLNLGCGRELLPGFVNVDKQPLHEVSRDFIQHDLEITPLPFQDETFSEIQASQLMEHIRNFPELMNECHRILKPGGTLDIDSPVYPHKQCFQDPTHVRFFTEETWAYFLRGHVLGRFGESYGFKMFSTLSTGRNPDPAYAWNLYVRLVK